MSGFGPILGRRRSSSFTGEAAWLGSGAGLSSGLSSPGARSALGALDSLDDVTDMSTLGTGWPPARPPEAGRRNLTIRSYTNGRDRFQATHTQRELTGFLRLAG